VNNLFSYPLSVIPLNCGRLFLEHSYFNGSMQGQVSELPVYTFLITHPQGNLLFDTGLPPELWLGFDRIELRPGLIATKGDSLGLEGELKLRGYRLNDISIVVNSHAHIDHCGGNKLFPEHCCYNYKKVFIKKDREIFEDWSIYLMSTPGHSREHQSLLIMGKNRQVLLTGDACFRPENLFDLKLPLIIEDQEEALQSLKKIRNFCKVFRTSILTSHDPLARGEPIEL